LIHLIEEAKQSVEIPIIASINCQTPKLWPRFARQLQDAGADGLELNVSFHPISLAMPSAEYEDQHQEILTAVKSAVSIPVSVKLKSQITSVAHLAQRLAESGCEALVLFNWFLEPDIDIENLKTKSRIGTANFFHSLRWVALLSGRVGCDVASSGGVETAEDVVKQILAGATVVQVCTLFYKKGLEEIQNLLKGLEDWMDRHDNKSIDDFRGDLSFRHQELQFKDIGEAGAYFRAQYLKAYSTK
jgi:dihydroorotate dehydrogenase (fumarate)